MPALEEDITSLRRRLADKEAQYDDLAKEAEDLLTSVQAHEEDQVWRTWLCDGNSRCLYDTLTHNMP